MGGSETKQEYMPHELNDFLKNAINLINLNEISLLEVSYIYGQDDSSQKLSVTSPGPMMRMGPHDVDNTRDFLRKMASYTKFITKFTIKSHSFRGFKFEASYGE